MIDRQLPSVLATPATVVLAWGSLIPRPGALPLSTDWSHTGPLLPVEFSRVSQDARLTLVLDRTNGVPVRTWWAGLDCHSTQDAVEALSRREGCRSDWIGWLDLEAGTASSNPDHVRVGWIVQEWAKARGVKRVVWTALPANFEAKTGQTFSVENAIDYLSGLRDSTREYTFEYIRRAPQTTHTPVRAAFQSRFHR